MRRIVSLLVLLGAVVAVLLVVAGSAWALNPQPQPPRVAGVVRDACTGLPVAGATVSLVSPTTGEADPGPHQTGPLGGFLVPAVMPGDYLFSVEAPGYDPVGKQPGPVGAPDGSIMLTLDPQPVGLAAGEAANETELASVLLAPASGCPTPLRPPNPNLPDIAGIVRNAATGLPVLRAQETLTPTSGERPPNPNFGFLGAFAWSGLDPGGYALSVTAPGFLGISAPDASGAPGTGPIPVTKQPGPPGFPDGSSVVFGKTFEVWLVPAV